jgi:hypothetical protein
MTSRVGARIGQVAGARAEHDAMKKPLDLPPDACRSGWVPLGRAKKREPLCLDNECAAASSTYGYVPPVIFITSFRSAIDDQCNCFGNRL